MILWLLIYQLFAFAQDQAIEEYCFSNETKMQQVQSRLKFILIPADKIELNQNCFTINTPSHRRELIQNYVRRIEPNAQIAFSSAELKREHCKIKVEKVRKKNGDGLAAGIDVKLNPSIDTNQKMQIGSDITNIQTMKDFSLAVNQDSIMGECRAINSDRYEITLTVKKEATPLLPPLPAGTVVVVANVQIPKEPQQTSLLQTTVQLNRGQKMEIGSVVKNLRNDSKKIDLNTGANLDHTNDDHNEIVYLSLD